MTKFGIVGFGRFGKLWANVLRPFDMVMVQDKSTAVIPHENGSYF